MHVHGEGLHPVPRAVVDDVAVIGERGVVDENVRRAEGVGGSLNQLLALGFGGDIDGNGDGLAPGSLDGRHGARERARQHLVVAFVERAGGTHNTCALAGEKTSDLGAYATASAGYDCDPSVELAHRGSPSVARPAHA